MRTLDSLCEMGTLRWFEVIQLPWLALPRATFPSGSEYQEPIPTGSKFPAILNVASGSNPPETASTCGSSMAAFALSVLEVLPAGGTDLPEPFR